MMHFLFDEMLNDMLAEAKENLRAAKKAQYAPHFVDLEDMKLITQNCQSHLDHYDLMLERLRHWQKQDESRQILKNTRQLQEKLTQLNAINHNILAIAEELRDKSITEFMEMDDDETALVSLLDEFAR